MTPYAILAAHAGLTLREASAFLGVPHSTITSWSSGRRRCPPGVLQELADLILRQERDAERTLDLIRDALLAEPRLAQVTIGFPVDDIEAKTLGMPSVGAWASVAARVMVRSPVPINLVPRGATPSTAMAADLRDMSDES